MDSLTKTYQIAKAEAGGYRFRITSGVVDRDQEVLVPEGMDARNFLLNPVILWNHDMDDVVGKASNLGLNPDGWEADIEFAPTEKGQEVKALVDGGFVVATSVRLLPRKWEDGDPKTTGYWRRYTDWELLEVSLVSVPANPTAIRVKSGRVLNRRNYDRLAQIKDMIEQIFRECERPEPDEPDDTDGAEPGKTASGGEPQTTGGLRVGDWLITE